MSISLIKRNIKFWCQRRTRGWSDDECWNLDFEFVKWINSRFKQYKKGASKVVDLEYRVYKYKKKKYTQLELIDRVIQLSDKLINGDYYFRESNEEVDEILDIFKLVYLSMWW